jgi:hypothetical protein
VIDIKCLHHSLVVCIRKRTYLLESKGWYCLHCYCLWFHSLSSSSLELYNLQCNSQHYPVYQEEGIQFLHHALVVCFWKRISTWEQGVVGVGWLLLEPMIPKLDHFFTLELINFRCDGHNSPEHWVIDIKCLHHPLVLCIRKPIYTNVEGFGLACIVTAGDSNIWPVFNY